MNIAVWSFKEMKNEDLEEDELSYSVEEYLPTKEYYKKKNKENKEKHKRKVKEIKKNKEKNRSESLNKSRDIKDNILRGMLKTGTQQALGKKCKEEPTV